MFLDDHFEKIGIYRLGFQSADTGCLGIVSCGVCPPLATDFGLIVIVRHCFLGKWKMFGAILGVKGLAR